jgi:hypothetical protein
MGLVTYFVHIHEPQDCSKSESYKIKNPQPVKNYYCYKNQKFLDQAVSSTRIDICKMLQANF